MDVAMFLLAFVVLWETSSAATQCYRCVPERLYNNGHIPLCENFDYSQPYVIECPNSTGCVKKETELLSLGVKTKSTERDCARQTMDGEQEKDQNGNWQMVNKIHEVYDVGCQEDSSEFDKPTKSTNCFCRGNLCNGADDLTRSGLALVFTVVLWLVFK